MKAKAIIFSSILILPTADIDTLIGENVIHDAMIVENSKNESNLQKNDGSAFSILMRLLIIIGLLILVNS